jgi:ML domain
MSRSSNPSHGSVFLRPPLSSPYGSPFIVIPYFCLPICCDERESNFFFPAAGRLSRWPCSRHPRLELGQLRSVIRGVYVTPCSCHLCSGMDTDAIQIESISVSPDPPKPGQNLTVTVKAYAQDEVKVHPYAYLLLLSSMTLPLPGGCICKCPSESRRYQDIAKDFRLMRGGVCIPNAGCFREYLPNFS